MRRPRWKVPWLLETERSAIGAKRLRRKVRLTVQMLPNLTFNGRESQASYAYADLDDAALDRLIVRLQRIRGGRSVL